MSSQMIDDSGMPQWKRELLQRRKCQLTASNNKPSASNGVVGLSSIGGDAVSVTLRSRQSVADCRTENMVEERLGGASPADADSDSSEELQYGPGIVNKLKCKYLSLALRESRKARPTVLPLRRATSLDDLLDDNVESHKQNVKVNDIKLRTNRALGRGNESLKRARSVETLLRCDRKPQGQVSEVGSRESFNEDVVIDERPVPAPRNNTPSNVCGVNQNNSNKPRRPAPLLADTERPPPDTVRSALRIFESTMRRARPLKPVGDVAVKVANYKHIISKAKKPAVLPKPAPVVVGVENIATVKPTAKPSVKIQPPTPVVYGFGSNMGLKPPSSPKNTKLIRTPPVSPKKQTMKNIILDTRENDRATSPRNLNASPVLFRSPSPSSPILLSPTMDAAPQSPQSPLIQQSTFPLTNGNVVNGSPTKQIGVIRPMEPPENERQKSLEHEKNLKNARESNELNNMQNNSWGAHKKSWHQQAENTMVFNFRNRKDVPDYIENDGLVMKTRRERPKVIYLRNIQ